MDIQFPDVDAELPLVLPPLRKLIAELTDCDEQGIPLNCAEGDLRACDMVLSAFYAAFCQSAENSAFDENEAVILSETLGLFQRIGQIFTVTYRSMRNNERDLTILNILALVESLFQLEELLQRQHTYRYEKPRLSQAEGINSILEAGNAVLDGRRDWEFLSKHLERLRPAVENLMRQDNVPPSFVAHGEAMRQLVAVCASCDADALPEALTLFKESGEALLHHDFNHTSPDVASDYSVNYWEEENLDSQEGEEPVEANAPRAIAEFAYAVPADLAKVAELAEGVRNGSTSCIDFMDGIDGIVEDLAELGNSFGLLLEREPNNEEERSALDALTELLHENRDKISHAMECFGTLRDPVNVEILDQGLEQFVGALNGVRQALLEAQKLEEMYAQ